MSDLEGAGLEPAGLGPAGAGYDPGGSSGSTTSERSAFTWGGTSYPLTPSTANSALKDADPACYYMLDYFATMLATYAGQRWSAECGLCNRLDISGSIVLGKTPYDPEPYLRQMQKQLPLLSVYRVSATVTEHTAIWSRSDTVFAVDWVMPPLAPSQSERLIPFTRAALDIITSRTNEKADAAYLDGADVWALAGLQEVSVTDARFGYWHDGDLKFPAARMRITCKERQGVLVGTFPTMTGADTQVDQTDGVSPVQHVSDVQNDF